MEQQISQILKYERILDINSQTKLRIHDKCYTNIVQFALKFARVQNTFNVGSRDLFVRLVQMCKHAVKQQKGTLQMN